MTATATGGTTAAVPLATPPRVGARIVVGLPDYVALAIAGFGLPAMILLLAGHFTAPYVLPLGVLGAAAAIAAGRLPTEPIDRRALWFTLAAIGVVVIWCAINVAFSAQDLLTQRDPATYNNAGRWLMDHGNLHLPLNVPIFGSPAGTDSTAAGFGANPGHTTVYAQGNHLLPAFLGVAGWLFGLPGLLKANVIFGGLALLVFYGLGRRILGAPTALLAMIAFSVSMPLIYVSRDTYSEPLALLLLMGGLGLLHRAVRGRRVLDFALAGFVAGSSASARIDSYVSLVCLIIVAAVLLAAAGPGQRAAAGRQCAALLVGALVSVIIGYLDVTRLAFGYYHDTRGQTLPIGVVAVVLFVLGGIAVWLSWRPSVRAALLSPAVLRRIAAIAGGLVVLVFVILASRPIWAEVHGKNSGALAATQRVLGVPIDGTRLYYEHALSWQAMYLGWPTVVLAAAGYVLLIRRVLIGRDLAGFGVLTMGGAMSALYLWTAQITPDQPWASRRFVPVVIPVLLLAAGLTVVTLWRARPETAGASGPFSALWRLLGRWARPVGVLAAAAIVIIPAVVTFPVRTAREQYPVLGQIQAICRATGPQAAFVMIDAATRAQYQQTVRSYCDVPAIGMINASPTQLATMVAAVRAHGRTLYALSTIPAPLHVVAGTPTPPRPFSSFPIQRFPQAIDAAPSKARHDQATVYLGQVQPDGLLRLLPPG